MKQRLKMIADVVAAALVLPAFLMYLAYRQLLGRQRAIAGWSQFFALVPGLTGVFLRRAFYRMAFGQCQQDVCISFGTVFSHDGTRLGRSVYLGAFCTVGDATIEDDVLIGSHVSIMNGSGQHGIDRLDVAIRKQPGSWPRVTIGRDSWIGDRAVVMADVGRHCVVGAGSVVTRALPDYSVAVGVPARVVRMRNGYAQVSDCTESLAHRAVG